MALWSKNSKTEQAPPPKAPSGSQKAATKPPVATGAPKELSAADMQKRKAASARLLLLFRHIADECFSLNLVDAPFDVLFLAVPANNGGIILG